VRFKFFHFLIFLEMVLLVLMERYYH